MPIGRSSTRKKREMVDFTIFLLQKHRLNNFDLRKTNAIIMTKNRMENNKLSLADLKKIRLGDLL